MTSAIASTITASITIVMLDALLNLASWARLRRRPPPAGAAFGRKFADNLFYLPQLLLLLLVLMMMLMLMSLMLMVMRMMILMPVLALAF